MSTRGNASNIPGLSVPGASAAVAATTVVNRGYGGGAATAVPTSLPYGTAPSSYPSAPTSSSAYGGGSSAAMAKAPAA